MDIIQEEGRFYAVRQDGGERIEVSEALAGCLESRYVVDYNPNGDRLTYTEAFYSELAEKLQEGMSQVEAYESFGFSVKVLGRDRANNACRRAREKHGGGGTHPSPSGEGVQGVDLAEASRGNPYVRFVSKDRVYYTDAFNPALLAELDSGKSPLEAYEALGFPLEKFGSERAYKAARHARDWRDRQAQAHFSLGDYDGTVPFADMIGEWGVPTCNTRWEAYLVARVITMEKREAALKKNGDLSARAASHTGGQTQGGHAENRL